MCDIRYLFGKCLFLQETVGAIRVKTLLTLDYYSVLRARHSVWNAPGVP